MFQTDTATMTDVVTQTIVSTLVSRSILGHFSMFKAFIRGSTYNVHQRLGVYPRDWQYQDSGDDTNTGYG